MPNTAKIVKKSFSCLGSTWRDGRDPESADHNHDATGSDLMPGACADQPVPPHVSV